MDTHSNINIQDNLSLDQAKGLDINRLLKTVLKYKFLIVGFAILITVLVSIVLANIQSVYQAKATILFDSARVQAVSVKEVYAANTQRQEYGITQLELLQSGDIARKVISKLDMYKSPDKSLQSELGLLDKLQNSIPFLPKKEVVRISPEKRALYEIQRKVKIFQKSLKVKRVGWSHLVEIYFEHPNPEVAAAAANAVGEIYIETQMAAKLGITEKASQWLGGRLDELRVRLDASEEKLQRYREQENLVDIDGAVTMIDNEVTLLTEQFNEARNELIQLKTIAQLINKHGENDKLKFISELKDHELIKNANAQLLSSELKHAELSKVYGPKHPVMQAAVEEVRLLKSRFNDRISGFIDEVDQSVLNAEDKLNRLQNELTLTKLKYQDVSKKELTFHKLLRDVEANKNLFNQFLRRSKETQVTGDFNSEPVTFVEKAMEPRYPIKPNKKKLVAIAFIFSVAFGIGLAILRELLNDTFKSVSDVESILSQRLLGTLPLLNLQKGEEINTHQFFDASEKGYSESVRTLRTNFLLTHLDSDNTVIEVTSSLPNEGKSAVSVSFSSALAQIENVLLIDADMRKPSLCKKYGIPSYHPGIANLIAGTEKFEDCIYVDEQSGVTIMPCGQLPPNPLELLSSEKFSEVIDMVRIKFDKVVIDTAPVQAVSDALIISKYADSILYVVKSDDTRTGIAKIGIGKLLQANAKVGGVVLNQLDMATVSKDENAYYYEYGNAHNASKA
ncbi:polysaccharide biosynthesis tyrosine autokinase [Pseudoalteromonas sp. C2R02]|uniref:GumC family protein n=1 Tax=Pseudoalteromonas sp. C2R02 TaxID=2841565 RepID=UPI001C0A47F9|nr:polysaccharide biosynthesis tyrosine autokinase [Pseudoalteromonas sp. C2R02]MBU2969565.1 polysaccharide biosynthesis tyrosine autokinase [Pseudoalteromonas sp. C2R02]